MGSHVALHASCTGVGVTQGMTGGLARSLHTHLVVLALLTEAPCNEGDGGGGGAELGGEGGGRGGVEGGRGGVQKGGGAAEEIFVAPAGGGGEEEGGMGGGVGGGKGGGGGAVEAQEGGEALKEQLGGIGGGGGGKWGGGGQIGDGTPPINAASPIIALVQRPRAKHRTALL